MRSEQAKASSSLLKRASGGKSSRKKGGRQPKLETCGRLQTPLRVLFSSPLALDRDLAQGEGHP